MRSRRRLAPLLVLAVALPGCGDSRTPPPDVSRPAAPAGEKTLTSKREGVRMDVPGNWAAAVGPAPLAIRTASGEATLSVWRYPRTEPLPEDPTALQAARRRLITEVKRHDKTVRISEAKVLKIAGAPAIQLVADETVAGARRRVRSTHVYTGASEYVVDAFAAPQYFPRVDATVFHRALHSMKLTPPGGP